MNKTHTAESLLSYGADPNRCGENNLAHLYRATCNGNERLVVALLKAGADPDCKFARYFESPLKVAAEKNLWKIAQILIGAGASINSEDPPDDFSCPANTAARYGSQETLKVLLDAGLHFSQKKLNEWLERAANNSKDDSKLIAYLLRKGAKVNCRFNYFDTALEISAKKNHYKKVKCLLKKGAKPGGKSSASPLFWAVENKNRKMARILLKYGACPNVWRFFNPLAKAAHTNQIKMARLLMRYGALVNIPPEHFRLQTDTCALYAAIRQFDLEMVQTLLLAGADPDYNIRYNLFDGNYYYHEDWDYNLYESVKEGDPAIAIKIYMLILNRSKRLNLYLKEFFRVLSARGTMCPPYTRPMPPVAI